jgi:hypothetical protein
LEHNRQVDPGRTGNRLQYADLSWMIENRRVKQSCGIEHCQAQPEKAQRNYIKLAMRAFLRIESHCFVKVIFWFEAKTAIVRDAVRAYLAKPSYTLVPLCNCLSPNHIPLFNFLNVVQVHHDSLNHLYQARRGLQERRISIDCFSFYCFRVPFYYAKYPRYTIL